MAKDLISHELQKIEKMATVCQQVAAALIKTQCAWISHGMLSYVFPTDYERARRQIMKHCADTKRRLAKIRRQTINPDAICADAHITKIQKSCSRCPKTNLHNVETGEAFTCLTQNILSEKS